MADTDLLLEAERRGLLPQDKLDALQEARRRGLVPPALNNPAEAVQQRSSAAQSPQAVTPQAELSARDPSFSERLSDLTGMDPQYWRRVVYDLKAPARFMEGAEEPFQGATQFLQHAASGVASFGGYAPNALSRFLDNSASTYDAQLARQQQERAQERTVAGIEPGTPDYARGIGNALSPATLETGSLGMAAKGANWLNRLYRAGVTGAAIGAEQPVYGGDYWSEKEKQAGAGALTGGALELGANVVAPWMTDQAQKLVDKYGIRVPFLSSVGRFPGRVEQIAQSVPFSGMATRAQFEQANDDLVRAAYNETLDPIRAYGFGGKRYTPKSDIEPGREMAQTADQEIGKSYNDVIPKLQSVLDDQFVQDVADIRASLPERVRPDFDDAVQRHVYNYGELAQPGTAPTAPPKYASPRQQAASPGYDIQLTLQKGDQPGQMAAQGKLVRPPAPPRQSVPMDPARAQLHVQNLDGAGADPKSFETAMDYLAGDKGVRKGELEQIYQAYTNRGPGKLTKDQMLDSIRQEFEAKRTQSPFILNGQNAKNADIGLRDEARSLIQNPGPDQYQRNVGSALADVRDALRDAWERHSPQEAIDQLKATDLAYRRNMILNRAASSSASVEGRFGPTQLWQAVKAADPTLGKRATAQGVAELQDLADAAKSVLGKTVADSGTPERGAAMWAAKELGPAIAVGGAAMSHAVPVVGALAGHGLMYTNPVQNALRFMARGGAPDRNALANFLRVQAFGPAVASRSRADQPTNALVRR